MLFGVGTLGEAIKNMGLEHKWKQNKKNGTLPSNPYLETVQQMQQKREDYNLAAITFKLNSGKKLTHGELDYLRKNSPSLYEEAVKVAKERQEYERRLQSCRTKEEVARMHTGAMSELVRGAKSGGGASGGNMLMRLASLTDAHHTFVGSSEYNSLPREHEEDTPPEKKAPKKARDGHS